MNFIYENTLDIAICLIIVVLFFTVLAMSTAFNKKQAHIARIRSIAAGTRRRIYAKQEKRTKKIREHVDFRSTVEYVVKTYLVKFTHDKASDVRMLFERAGWSPINAVVVYALIKIASFIAFGFITFIFIEKLPFLIDQSWIVKYFVMSLNLLIGLQFFDYILKFKAHMREQLIKRDLSSALDLLAICTNGGLSIDRSLEYISEEMAAFNLELCKELAMTGIELNILPERTNAFRNLAKRVYIPLIRTMSTTLIQSEEQGTSISSTLKVLSNEFRQQKISEIETRAAKLPAILSLPIILFTLPSLLIMILGPTIISLIRESG